MAVKKKPAAKPVKAARPPRRRPAPAPAPMPLQRMTNEDVVRWLGQSQSIQLTAEGRAYVDGANPVTTAMPIQAAGSLGGLHSRMQGHIEWLVGSVERMSGLIGRLNGERPGAADAPHSGVNRGVIMDLQIAAERIDDLLSALSARIDELERL